MLKKKWTGRSYGHDYVVDYATLRTRQDINYRPAVFSKKMIVFICLVVGTVTLFSIDAYVQANQKNEFNTFQKEMFQLEWLALIGERNPDFNKSVYKDAAAKSGIDFTDYLKYMGFFGKNSFNLEEGNGIVYINSTNMLGRLLPFMAKRIHVAIIFNIEQHFELPAGSSSIGVKELQYRRLSEIGVTSIELEVPAEHWGWFARQMTRHLIQEDLIQLSASKAKR